MNELETRLRDLGRELALPQEPDLAEPVAARLHRPPRPSRRRPLLVALALVALALAIAFAVPPARSAILRFFHLGAVSVERVETLPPARVRPLTAGLGRPLDRAEAERRAGFALILPPLGGRPPTQVFARDPNLLATVLDAPVGGGRRKPILLVEIEGSDLGAVKKVAGPGTRIAPTNVNGLSALWIRGPHVIAFVRGRSGSYDAISRVSGSALIWELGARTFRLEGNLTEAEALRVARTITPT